MKIVCSQDCTIKSENPLFKYKFVTGEPLEVDDAHVEKILKNDLFKEVKQAKAKKSKK